MTELISALKKKFEFDEQAAIEGSGKHHPGTRRKFAEGARWQSEQLKPILLAMVDIVRELDRAIEVMQFAYMNAPAQPKEIETALAALARLKEAVEAKEAECAAYVKHGELFEESIRHSFKVREDALRAERDQARAELAEKNKAIAHYKKTIDQGCTDYDQARAELANMTTQKDRWYSEHQKVLDAKNGLVAELAAWKVKNDTLQWDKVEAELAQACAKSQVLVEALERIEIQNLDGLIECPVIAREALKQFGGGEGGGEL